jgi:glutamate carboxypeptidase
MAEAARLAADLLALSEHDAPSGDPAASAGAVEWLAARLNELGAGVVRHETATGVVLDSLIGPKGGPPVLILCHYDTVWPAGTAAARPARQEGGAAYGPGVFDMRGGIAAALAAVEFAAPLERPVQILLTPDEETGSAGSSELIAERARDAALVLVPEPPLPGGCPEDVSQGLGQLYAEGRRPRGPRRPRARRGRQRGRRAGRPAAGSPGARST